MPELQDHALDVRVNIERRRAQKANKSLIAFASKIDRECRWRGDRSHDWNSGGKRFLHDFKGSATANEDYAAIQRQLSVQERAADCFVHSVVTANVFAHNFCRAV